MKVQLICDIVNTNYSTSYFLSPQRLVSLSLFSSLFNVLSPLFYLFVHLPRLFFAFVSPHFTVHHLLFGFSSLSILFKLKSSFLFFSSLQKLPSESSLMIGCLVFTGGTNVWFVIVCMSACAAVSIKKKTSQNLYILCHNYLILHHTVIKKFLKNHFPWQNIFHEK